MRRPSPIPSAEAPPAPDSSPNNALMEAHSQASQVVARLAVQAFLAQRTQGGMTDETAPDTRRDQPAAS